ncbi:hypothetical protein SH2C18_11580 [Clostridium sediminicola]|uniref:ArnT family glycosyltransferase n=1 Tax=Clostridium sediminicola TaxID=3114879 RepID=UPI0031F1E166
MQVRKLENMFILIYITIYSYVNVLFLEKYPFIHSDEVWLAGLTRNMMENKSFSVTESFFDLYPRAPHAIKMFFHGFQMIFIKLFGYNIFSVRLMSHIFGIISLLLFYKLCLLIFKSSKISIALTILMSLDSQFIYASHFGRNEILIFLMIIVSLFYFFNNIESLNYKHDIVAGILTGISIGFHPNAFMIFISMIFVYLFYIFIRKKKTIKNLILYFAIVSIFGIIFILVSLKFNINFFRDYFEYGKQFGVNYPIESKINQIKFFYIKLFYGISGTYYTPDIKFQLILFSIAFFTSILKLIFIETDNENFISPIILFVLGINMGIILIGRFNQTSVIFIFPFLYILIYYCIKSSNFKLNILIFLVLSSILGYQSYKNIVYYKDNNYESYLTEISTVVPNNAEVLGNLNSEFYFDNKVFHDYRNLGYLKEANKSFEEYITENKIQYIIYPEEMDFIYEKRPKWNGLYGNVAYYYEDMQNFFEHRCELLHEFSDKVYGMRIVRYINTKDWNIKIYKVVR